MMSDLSYGVWKSTPTDKLEIDEYNDSLNNVI